MGKNYFSRSHAVNFAPAVHTNFGQHPESQINISGSELLSRQS
jgi:hypothetical protein